MRFIFHAVYFDVVVTVIIKTTSHGSFFALVLASTFHLNPLSLLPSTSKNCLAFAIGKGIVFALMRFPCFEMNLCRIGDQPVEARQH
jgi:hypothetical protein